jgi:ADP-ribose pyrophosphatase YjhB (NUDIX family)
MEDVDQHDVKDCAIREVFEETGLTVDRDQLNEKMVIDRTTYFYIECDENPISVQQSTDDNDANGIGWIKVDCLRAMLSANEMSINYHCKRLLKRFLNFNHSYN